MKRKLLLALLIVLVLSGCNFFAGLFNPLVGNWRYSQTTTVFGSTGSFIWNVALNGDNSFSMTLSFTMSGYAPENATAGGTWTNDSSTLTFDVTSLTGANLTSYSSGNSYAVPYSFSSDKQSLTIGTGASALTFTRQ